MANPGIGRKEALARIKAVEKALKAGHPPPGCTSPAGLRGAIRVAIEALGGTRSNNTSWMDAAVRHAGRQPDWTLYRPAEPVGQRRGAADAMQNPLATRERIIAVLRGAGRTEAELAEIFAISRKDVHQHLGALRESGSNLHCFNGVWSIEALTPPAYTHENLPEYVSRPDNTYVFGVTSDNHLGSKYERLDVLRDLYAAFAAAGVDRAFNAGNWIDGEARFNKHELHTHGIDGQLRYMANVWPNVGVTTYAVAGDDHEGWYAQREGIDVGRYAERIMRDAGRTDWVNLGYMESHVRLVNANTGRSAILAVVHPGGGSAYALSYSTQKIIESLDGGEKPAVGIYGHYHKMWAGNIRNVWCLQPGTTQDQSSFMRKKKLEAHVGGVIVTMRQDPDTGAITDFLPDMRRYFNAGYYELGRWSHSDPARTPRRTRKRAA